VVPVTTRVLSKIDSIVEWRKALKGNGGLQSTFYEINVERKNPIIQENGRDLFMICKKVLLEENHENGVMN
jgi:hypothetical protein